MIHNPTCQVSNATRDLLLKYYYSSRDRKGFVYYASASVLRFIRDLAEKHEKKHRRDWSRRKSTRTGGSSQKRNAGPWHDSEQANKLLEELSKRGGDFWATNEEQDDGRHHFGDHLETDPYLAAAALPDVFDANSGHLCMFIKPQVSLQSDVDDKSTLIFTAFRAQVKVFQIVDSRIPEDPVNSEVLHQTFARLDGMQIFYPRQQLPRRDGHLQAFVPLETLIDLRVEPWGFDRVVARTSAALRYDKFNQLRLSSKRDFGDGGLGPGSSQLESHFHTSTDRISFEADKFTLSANPAHFAAVYNVVTNLVLYSDPARKSRNRDIEALVFTRDFSDLRSLLDTVSSLQQRLRRFGSLRQEYLVHLDELDEEGRLELFMSRAELFKAASELSLVVEAFTRAQDSNGPKTTSKRAGLQLEAHAAELTWHMLDKSDLPLAKFSVIGAEFSWASKQDGSASNRMVIKDLRALNSSPEQVFAEIVAKVEGCGEDNQLAKVDIFAAALWNTHAPVGGIAIIERFELHLHPIKLQLEHRVGRKILDYLFAERQQKSGDGGDDTPASRNGSRLSLPTPNSSASRSAESLALPRTSQSSSNANLPLASSSASIRSVETRVRKAISTEALITEDREEGLDADEMRRRAATNRTFIFVEVSSTVLCLTYRVRFRSSQPFRPWLTLLRYTEREGRQFKLAKHLQHHLHDAADSVPLQDVVVPRHARRDQARHDPQRLAAEGPADRPAPLEDAPPLADGGGSFGRQASCPGVDSEPHAPRQSPSVDVCRTQLIRSASRALSSPRKPLSASQARRPSPGQPRHSRGRLRLVQPPRHSRDSRIVLVFRRRRRRRRRLVSAVRPRGDRADRPERRVHGRRRVPTGDCAGPRCSRRGRRSEYRQQHSARRGAGESC